MRIVEIAYGKHIDIDSVVAVHLFLNPDCVEVVFWRDCHAPIKHLYGGGSPRDMYYNIMREWSKTQKMER